MTNIAREILFDRSIPVFDAIDFLTQGHQEIINYFDNYNRAKSLSEKQQIAKKICKALTINLHLEDDIFYQEVKRTLMEKGWLSAITMEHSVVKYLLSEIEGLDADSAVYDIKIKVLGEHVKYLIKEKQTKLFPKVNRSNKIDRWKLGAQLAARQSFLENAFASK
ncbi:hypothetical protein GCM10011613_12440 [Cellvibrio zantedeschiae]|uniref:Hemerythrin-like domain-containing protein n=1 Tax=Cellvibrio zantedeschiae TaxID=1237077 RepID=A0ABQ3AW15_9GAMM|nr:hemerythrin domain-containing protein [Cellvibrio zantedeschiae]GGY69609.1 hypothetical protein GCM10011613_12440 [Cellvibrio zantedeschiae]